MANNHSLQIIIYCKWQIRWYSDDVAFDHVMIPIRGNWFQTKTREHESDDRAGNTVSSVCVTNGKDMALQRQIWSTFVTVLWFRKTEFQDSAGILILVRVLWVTISKIYWQFWHGCLKYTFKSSSTFSSLWNWDYNTNCKKVIQTKRSFYLRSKYFYFLLLLKVSTPLCKRID